MKVVHCFRDPSGGLFRHVRDLAEAQHAAGHAVGVVCDAAVGDPLDEHALEAMRPVLSLGLMRFPMRRQMAPSDLAATWRIAGALRPLAPDVLHGHGAKGGAYGRAVGTLLRATGSSVARIYTPHGGSLHFDAQATAGRVFFAAERFLGRMTDAFIFVSRFEAETYASKVGKPHAPATVVPNGLRPEEFEPVAPNPDAADFLFIGTLRDIKGPDVLIEALALLRDRTGKAPTAVIVGGGVEKTRYIALAAERGLGDTIAFRDPMPARDAFPLGRVMVVPSRAESMPYIVLETIAAAVPLIATAVGGIPEIYGAASDRLVPPGDASALANAMATLHADPAAARNDAMRLREQIRPGFSVAAMADAISGVYRTAISG